MSSPKNFVEKHPFLTAIVFPLALFLFGESGLFSVFVEWVKASSWSMLVNFVNDSYVAAASLQPLDYSFYMLTAIFTVVCVGFIVFAEHVYKSIVKKDEIDKKRKSKVSEGKVKLIALSGFLYIGGVLFYVFVQLAGEVITLNAITDFNQHIRIIKPYISDEQYDRYLSEWSQMRSLDDYNKIYESLLNVANEHKVTLYKSTRY